MSNKVTGMADKAGGFLIKVVVLSNKAAGWIDKAAGGIGGVCWVDCVRAVWLVILDLEKFFKCFFRFC